MSPLQRKLMLGNKRGIGNKSKFVHGESVGLGPKKATPEYAAYHAAKTRCTNQNCERYSCYGGRGIKFLFKSFAEFLDEIGRRPTGMSLDRKDNDGNYEPGNVRWATAQEQYRSRRH